MPPNRVRALLPLAFTVEKKHEENPIIPKIPTLSTLSTSQFTHQPRILPFQYGDRFIPRRYYRTTASSDLLPTDALVCATGLSQSQHHSGIVPALASKSSANGSARGSGTGAGLDDEEPNDILDVERIDGYWRLGGLRDCLDAAFAPTDGRPPNVLHLHDWLTECLCRSSVNQRPTLNMYKRRYSINMLGLDWPCVPRAKRIAFTNSSHDLPGFHRFSREHSGRAGMVFGGLAGDCRWQSAPVSANNCSCVCVCLIDLCADLNIISWSPLGQIAASFGVDLVVWLPRSDDTVVYRLEGIKTLEYSADGKFLAASVNTKQNDVHRAGMQFVFV